MKISKEMQNLARLWVANLWETAQRGDDMPKELDIPEYVVQAFMLEAASQFTLIVDVDLSDLSIRQTLKNTRG